MSQYFTPATMKFLKDLKSHNNREWFAANKTRYETDVKEPALRFIADLASKLKKISPHFVADVRPVGGSLFRIYKDTRFSKDKTPYKTHVGAHFPHRDCGKDASAPGFYMHISPGESFGGGGIWHPSTEALLAVREHVVAESKVWKKITKGLKIEGSTLARAPRGFDPDHPLIDDLKRKDFYVMKALSDKEVCSDLFMDNYLEACAKAAPLVRFISDSLGLSFK